MVKRAFVLVTALRWALEDCAGLPLFKRALLAAQKGGIEEFYVLARESAKLQPLLQDARFKATICWVEESLPEEFFKSSSAVVIKGEMVFNPRVIEKVQNWELGEDAAHLAVRKGMVERGTLVRLEGEKVSGIGGEEGDALTAGILLVKPEALKGINLGGHRNPITFPEVIRHLSNKGSIKAVNLSREFCQEVTSIDTFKESRNALYKRVGLSTDGLMSMYVNRKLSGLVTRLLIRLPITPNQITICSLLIGLVACWFFWQGGYWHCVFAALIYYASVIVDLSDGEVARLKFMQSWLGAWLDSICDSIIYAGVLVTTALALSRAGYPYVLWAGLAAAISAIIILNLEPYLFSQNISEGVFNMSASFTERLANVDTFQIALFIFVFSGKLLWFIWGMAVGWTVYLIIFFYKLFFRWLNRRHATG
ncbi:MAG TPA: CDP-alcohol phosphatidyltransferase family protein [Candidatus Hypogeohydataceae bacterium YC41]